MANINEILARAAALRGETALNSISPERAGGIMYDTLLALNELWLQQGAALVISKIYASISAMEADTAPVSDLTGKPLRPGQIVVIASSDSDNGSVYRYNGTESPSWSLVGSIGNLDPVDSLDSDSTTLPLAAHQGKVLDGKISQLGQKVDAKTVGTTDELITPEINKNYFIRAADGAVLSGNNFAYTAKFSASKGQVIFVQARGFLQNVAIISKVVTEGSSYTPLVASVDSTTREYTYHVEEDGYYAVCFNYNSPWLIYLVSNAPADLVSRIQQNEAYKKYFIGQGNTYSTSPNIYNLKPGNKYRVSLKVVPWDMTGITVSGVAKFSIHSFYNGTATSLVYVDMSQDAAEFYDITIPENSDYIRIGGRAANGAIIYFDILAIFLADGSVTTEKLAGGSVATEKLANGAVNDEKADGRLQESKFINAIGRYQYDITQIVLNAFLNTSGNPNNINGWGYVRFIPLMPNTTITMGTNALGYVIKYRALYDKNKQFIAGSFASLGRATTINCDAIIASNPTAKYIGIDLIDPSESGSGTIVLTPTNTEDWIINIKSKYVDEITDLDNRVTALENRTEDNTLVFSADNSESYIQSPFDNDNDFRLNFKIRRTPGQSQNPCFNFQSGQLINKSTAVATTVHNCSDDICPGNYNGGYIGANHGQDATTITATAHGKTFADIGSKWTDGTRNFYIVAIISENEIQLLSDNNATYPLWSFSMPNVGTLTHISGATHTGNITISARATSQIKPIMSLVSTRIIADEALIVEPGTYSFEELKICQIYSVYNPASILQKIINAVGTFSANPDFANLGADVVMRHSITYGFTSAQECTVTTDFLAFQNVSLGYFGFTQQGVLSGDNVKMYIPKALPISNGSTTLDFRTIAAHNSVPSTMDLTSQYWENPNFPPDRWIQFANNVSFVGGYLFDKGVGGNERKNVINNSFYLYTSRKCYPHGIDSKISLSAGQSYSAVTIRKYIPVVSSAIPGFIPTMFEYNGDLYIYFDSWTTGIKTIVIPDKYINGEIVIFEKSDNVTLLSSSVSREILIQIAASSPMYGYFVAKIKK